jgi:ABC-type transporter Mla MlaB component
MSTVRAATAMRPGEHGCARLGRAADRAVLTGAFVRNGLQRGHRVIYHCEHDGSSCLVDDLAADPLMAEALTSGQLEVRPAQTSYAPDGAFEVTRTLEQLRADHAAALREGYPALSVAGDMSWAASGTPGAERLEEYERRIDADDRGDTLVLFCQYDQARFDPGVLGGVAAAHGVDVSPELAALSHAGNLAAGRTAESLRFAGELDYDAAEAVARTLAAPDHGPLRLDLADVEFIDVTGMRALRSRAGRPLIITAASPTVRRLLTLLAWDTDPAVEIVPPS